VTDDYEVETEVVRPSYPFNHWGVAYNLAVFGSRVASEVSGLIQAFATDFGAHNNWLIDRRQERWDEEYEAAQRTLLADDLASLERGEL
jgi:hypothetical protein